MRTERSLKDWGLLAILVVFWGSAFMMITVAVKTIPPLTLSAARLSLAACVLLIALKLSGEKLPPLFLHDAHVKTVNSVWVSLLGLGLLGNALPFLLLAWGQTQIPSSIASIFLGFSPLTTLVLAHFFIRGEHITRTSALGFFLGFIGICVLMGPSALAQINFNTGTLVFQIAIIIGAVSMGLSNVIAKRMGPVSPLGAASGLTLLAALAMIPIALIVDRPWNLAPSSASLAMLVLLGLLPTGLANVIFFFLIRRTGAVFLALANYLTIPWAVLMGMVFLGERPGWNALLALLLILSGVGISQSRSRRMARL